jgi:hypothetical protein
VEGRDGSGARAESIRSCVLKGGVKRLKYILCLKIRPVK